MVWRRLILTQLDRAAIKASLQDHYPDSPERRIINWAGQFCAFKAMKPGDLIAIPRKATRTVAFGEVTSEYRYDPAAQPIYRNKHTVKWLNTSVPRTNIEKDLLLSMGATQSIYQISRDEAERRIRALAKNGWGEQPRPKSSEDNEPSYNITFDEAVVQLQGLEELAQDEIAKLIMARFKGHGLARLVNAILNAQGYATHLSKEGPDKGEDILAGSGPLGFGSPRICVQVKSGTEPTDMATVRELIGAMQNVHAEQGLFVSWSGFKTSVDRERAAQFFRVRLWDQADLMDEMNCSNITTN